MRTLYQAAGWCIAACLLAARATCRGRNHDDPRPAIREGGRAYVYAILHAHQVAAMYQSDDKIGAMVSASKDGDLLAPSIVARGLVPVRASTRKDGVDKGGKAGIVQMIDLLRRRVPVLLAVDGPRGPRNTVHKGAAILAHETGVPVLPAMALPTRRWIFEKAWDRFQIPKPFSTVHIYYGEPIEPDPDGDVEATRERIRVALDALEARLDPDEHVYRGKTRQRSKPSPA